MIPRIAATRAMDSGLHDELARRMARHVGRHTDTVPDWDAFPASDGFPELERAPIRPVGAGGSPKVEDPGTLPADHFTLSIVQQPVGRYGASHAHEVEEACLVLEGRLTVAREERGQRCEQRLGPRDLLLTPPGQPRAFRNESPGTAQFMMVVGTPAPEDVEFRGT